MNKHNTYSDYWLDDIEEFNLNSEQSSEGNIQLDMIRLAAAKRAISNFVQILTNKSIPVYFNNSDANLTDGKNVYLSADIIKKEDFDPAVGLALHEGSHILLSDFGLLKTMWMKIPREIYDITEPKNISKITVHSTVKQIWNIIEDRYIDDYIYKNAPGYRGYYHALYDKYFYSTKVDDMLKSNMYREPSIDAYISRICNFMNINTDLNALPKLRIIAKTIDIKNIGRLTTPDSRFEVAKEVCKLIFESVGNDSGVSQGNVDGDNLFSEKEKDDTNKDEKNLDSSDALGGVKTESLKVGDSKKLDVEKNDGDTSEFNQNKLKQIKKALEKQKDFIAGNLKKKKVTNYQKILLDNIEKSGITIEKVGKDFETEFTDFQGIDCVLVRNMTRELIESEEFPMAYKVFGDKENDDMINAIKKGIITGNKLGSKLLCRNEKNIVKYMRKSDGKIDKRIISELGFENDRIFCNYKSENYNNAYIHISVDASSSMSGIKWYETISTVTSICKACSIIENIRVSVSFRTTISTKQHTYLPYIVMAYDSGKDKFSKIPNLFKYLIPNGTTPEGLAFESTVSLFEEFGRENNCYFLNFSDGEPFMTFEYGNIRFQYSGERATIHTKKQISKIKEKGYEILSYYINESYYNVESSTPAMDKSYKQFKTMYGNNSVFINTNNINSVAKTINQMFLKKDENFN